MAGVVAVPSAEPPPSTPLPAPPLSLLHTTLFFHLYFLHVLIIATPQLVLICLTTLLTMEPWNTERLRIIVVAVIRCIFVFLNNVYCIPVYFAWLLFLQPIKCISVPLYWRLEGLLFRWLLSMVALWSYSAEYYIQELGDDVWDLIDKRTLVLFNHQSTADVPLIMHAFNSRQNISDNIMWIMDHVFKFTNFGIISWAHGDFFIKGGKVHREASLSTLGSHLTEFYLPRGRRWLVLFPEGGFLKNRKPTSQRFARKNNLPILENVALPRVGALKVILDNVAALHHQDEDDKIKFVLDVTIAYPGGRPLDLQTIFGGWRPTCNTIFHYRRWNIEEIPRSEEALTTWLYDRYQEKENILQDYYDSGSFPKVVTPHLPPHQPQQPVPQLPGDTLIHDHLEFIVRHGFFIMSTIMWFKIYYWIYNSISLQIW